MTYISRNYDAVKYWLLYLQNALQLSCLIGNDNNKILLKAKSYELSQGKYSYGVEMPLKGSAGIDLSVQYCAADFFNGSHFLSAEAQPYDTLFSEYTDFLAKDNRHILPHAMLYLEADTFSGDDRKAGVFFNLSGAFVKPVLPEILRLQGLSRYEESIFRMTDSIRPVLMPWLFGFMYSRKEFSVRVVCYLTKDSWDKLPTMLEKIGYKDIPEEDLLELAEFVKNKDTGVLINLDVLPEGKIGNMLGVELSAVPSKIIEQRQWLESMTIQRFISLIRKWDISDGRVERLRDCIFSVGFQPQNMSAFNVTSGFSHFKLRWDKGQRLPAKVYLHVKKDSIGN